MKNPALIRMVALCAAVGAPTDKAVAVEAANRPNILLILADDLGYADVGFNGAKDIRTPALDRLAKGGTVFTSFYVGHPFCGPSRASLMTGRYPQVIGVPYNLPNNSSEDDRANAGVPRSETLMSDVLHDAGYLTGVIGKWHLGASPKYHPNQRGFDDFFGFLGGGHEYFPTRYKRPADRPTGPGSKFNWEYLSPLEHNGTPVVEKEYLTDALSREAVRFIGEAKRRQKPFFLYLAYNAPHVPLQAKEEDLRECAAIPDVSRRNYSAMVHAMDRGVGQLVEALKAGGQYENTLIVFLSDNGGNIDHGADNTPLRGTKGDTWEGGFRVPMFLHWAGTMPAGRRFDHPASALDLYPTFSHLAAAPIPPGKKLDGRDIWDDVLAGRGPHQGQMIYALRYRYGYCDVAARMDGWKIVRVANEPWRLIKLDDDIGEMRDLRGRNAERFRKMVTETEQWSATHLAPLWFNSAGEARAWKEYGMPNYQRTFRTDD